MRRFLLLISIAAMLSVLVRHAPAQDVASPIWTKAAAQGTYAYSKNGSVLIAYDQFTVRAWSTATQQLIAHCGLTADSVVPANDGSGFFYSQGSPGKVCFYNFATRTATTVHSEAANYQKVLKLTLSGDGTKMAFKAYNTTTAKMNIVVCDAATGTSLNRWPLPPGVDTQQVAFVNNDTKILVGGLRLFTVTGTLLASSGMAMNTFAVSPDTNKIYTQDAVNGRLHAYNVSSGLNWMWTTEDPSEIQQGFQVSSDGNTLISKGSDQDGTLYDLEAYSTFDGLPLNTMVTSSGQPYSAFALHPSSNVAVYFDTEQYQMKKSSYSVNGTGTNASIWTDFSAGSMLQMVGTAANPRVAIDDEGLLGWTNVFNADTGATVTATPRNGAIFSPNGTHYAWIGSDSTYGMHIYRLSDGAKIATYTSNEAAGVGWGSDSNLWVFRNSNRVRTYSFNGTTLTLLKDWAGPTTSAITLSKDGTRLAWTNGKDITVYNAISTASVGVLNTGSTITDPLSVRFAGNYLAVHDWIQVSTVFTNRLRLFDVATNAFGIIRQVSFSMNGAPYEYGHARISEDQSVALFVRGTGQPVNELYNTEVRIYRMWDGALLKQYNTQFSDFNYSDAGIAVGNATAAWINVSSKAVIAIDLPPILNGVSVNPTTVLGGSNTTGTVTINRKAPAGGVTVNLSADAGLTVPASVTITAGNTSANFTVNTAAVNTDTIKNVTASYGGLGWQAPITVTAASSFTISFNPPSVFGGTTSVGMVTLNGPAGSSGYQVNLSSNKSFVTVPATVTVPSGATSVTFNATTTDPGATEIATVTGTHGGFNANGQLEVKTREFTVEFLETNIKGGNALTMRIELQFAAPAGGLQFNLTGDALCTPPATVTVPAGASSYEVGVETVPTGTTSTTTLTAKIGSAPVGKTASATVDAPLIQYIKPTLSTVTGAKTVKVYVLLDGPAPANMSVNLLSSNGAITVPTTLAFTAGSPFASFDLTVKKQTVHKSVTITVGSKTFIVKIKAAP